MPGSSPSSGPRSRRGRKRSGGVHKAGQKEREERKERAAALRCATCGALCSITFTGCAQPAGRAAVPGHEGPSQPIARGRCAGRGHCGRWGTKGAESSGRVWGAAFSAVTLGLSGCGGERPWGVRAPDRRAAVGGTCGWSSEILTSLPAQAVLRFCAETSEIAGSNPPRQAVRTLRCRRRAASRGPPESNAGRALQTRLLSEGCCGGVPAVRGAFGGVPAVGRVFWGCPCCWRSVWGCPCCWDRMGSSPAGAARGAEGAAPGTAPASCRMGSAADTKRHEMPPVPLLCILPSPPRLCAAPPSPFSITAVWCSPALPPRRPPSALGDRRGVGTSPHPSYCLGGVGAQMCARRCSRQPAAGLLGGVGVDEARGVVLMFPISPRKRRPPPVRSGLLPSGPGGEP